MHCKCENVSTEQKPLSPKVSGYEFFKHKFTKSVTHRTFIFFVNLNCLVSLGRDESITAHIERH